MIRSQRLLFSALGSAVIVALAAACADSDAVPNAPNTVPEGGVVPPVPDAGAVDASEDAAESGAIDAGPRECSKEGFCHTQVPAGQSLRGVWSDGAGATWAISQQGAILRYDGAAWSVHATGLGELFSIWGSSPTDIWVGSEGSIFHGQGATSASLVFTPMSTPGDQNSITSIWGTGVNDVWAVGGRNTSPLQGRLLHFTGEPGKDDAGAEWSLESVYENPIWLLRGFGSTASGVWVIGTIQERDGQFLRRRTMLRRRSAGSAEFVEVTLPRDPKFPDTRTGDLERLIDASVSADGLSVWILGKTSGSVPAILRGTSSDGGQTFAWDFQPSGPSDDPPLYGVGAVNANDAYVVGDYSRLRHWDGTKWKQSVVTVTKFPFTSPLYAMGGKPNDLWFVGEGVALHRDPSKAEQ